MEFQSPEQTFPEQNVPLYQGSSSTYPAMPGSMSREDIEGYLASLRNGKPQGLTADGVSGLGIPELGNLDGGVEGGSNIRTFREATQTDADLINSLKTKYNAGKTRNVANARGYINGESINLESFMYGIDIFENIKMPIDWYMIYWGIKSRILRVDIAPNTKILR